MLEKHEIDIQARAVLNGLKNLEELLEQPIAREALDLTRNATTALSRNVLIRLRRSLTQYLEREGDLLYAGLLGHFSSGKSSTINSILNLWETPNCRETGLNPTDTTITLITQQKNISSLLGVIREGLVTIRSQAVESPLLTHMVLADTPGTGDPHLVEEISRDFLPICDVILFVFSATSPLDQSDTPLLAELHKRLPFMPIKFVVTRADELAISRTTTLTEATLDPNKKAQFLAEVIVRINKLLAPQKYSERDFLLIDNKASYNVAALTQYLTHRSDPADPGTRIAMHSHKRHYYLIAAKELRQFFAKFLDEKLSELTKIVEAAEKNVGKYNELVRISNNNLTRAWYEQASTTLRIREDNVGQLQLPTDLPNSIWQFSNVAQYSGEIGQTSAQLASWTARQVSARIRLEFDSQIREFMNDVREGILKVPLEQLTANSHGIRAFDIEPDFSNIELVPSDRLNRMWIERRALMAGALETATRDLKHKLSLASRLLRSQAPLAAVDTVVLGGMENLKGDLERFFDTVELYRDGVFSHRTKASISTLGIGQKLDDLESSFNDSDKSKYTAEATQEMFPNYEALRDGSARRLKVLEEQATLLSREIGTLELVSPISERRTVTTQVDQIEAELKDTLLRELRSDTAQVVTRMGTSLSTFLGEIGSAYDQEIGHAMRQRRRRYVFISVAFGITMLLIYIGLRYLQGTPTQTLVATIGWGVVANLIGDGIGYTIARFRDDFPHTEKKIKEAYRAEIREATRKILDREINNTILKSSHEAEMVARFASACSKAMNLGPTEWYVVAEAYLKSLHGLSDAFRLLRDASVTSVRHMCDGCAKYFEDPNHNLSVLNDVALRIKERAIEPSSVLLKGTRLQLGNVKDQIVRIEFD